MSTTPSKGIAPETYEFGLLQRLKHEFEPQGFKVCGTENGVAHHVKGRFSLSKRQLDVAVYRSEEDDIPFLIADAKRYRRKLNVKHVECFIGMMDDIGAEIGLLVAPKGCYKPAERRAKAANLTIKIMSPTEALEFQWLPLARSIYPWDWIFHLELSRAVRYLKAGAEPESIIDALEGIAFEEWEAFVQYSLAHHNKEAIQMLELIAVNHLDDGWRYNAIRLLWESGNLDEKLVQTVKSRECDPEILEFVELWFGEM